MSAKDYAGALANPFDGPVSGIIDEFGGKTVAFRVNQTQLLSTPAGIGYTGAIIKTCNISAGALQTIVSDVNGTTFAATNIPLEGITDLTLHYDQYRPVSMGVKVYYTGTESTTAGTVSVAIINGATSYLDFPADWDECFNLPDCHTTACASMTEPIVAMCHSFDRPRFGAWTNTFPESFFPAIAVWGAGLPVNTAGLLRLEVSFVLEAIPKYGSILTQHQAKEVPYDPVAMASVHRRVSVARAGDASNLIYASALPLAGKIRRSKTSTKKRKVVTGHSVRPTLRMPAMGRRSSGLKSHYRKKRTNKRKLFRR